MRAKLSAYTTISKELCNFTPLKEDKEQIMHLKFTTVSNLQDITDILALQAANHISITDEATQSAQGFVTVRHDPDVLSRMNMAYPSIIARANDELAGYALMMPRSFRKDIPILEPMFTRLDSLSWRDAPLTDQKWFVMGQICVNEKYRGQGVFDGLYQHLQSVWKSHFDFVITEVSERNPRSMRAHERVGFEVLYAYTNDVTGERWRVLVLYF